MHKNDPIEAARQRAANRRANLIDVTVGLAGSAVMYAIAYVLLAIFGELVAKIFCIPITSMWVFAVVYCILDGGPHYGRG